MNSYVNKPNNRFLLFMSILIILLLLIIRDLGDYHINKVVFLLLFAFSFIILDIQSSINLLLLAIPLQNGLPSNYIYLIFMIIIIYKRFETIKFDYLFLFPLLIFLLEILNSINHSLDIVFIINLFVQLVLPILLLVNLRGEIDDQKCLNYFLLGVFFVFFIIVYKYIQENSFRDILNGRIRLGNIKELIGDDSMQISYNPNGLGNLSIIAMAIFLIKVYTNETSKLINILGAVVAFIVGILTYSRTFLISFLLLILLISGYMLAKNKVGKVLNTIILLITLFVFVFLLLPHTAISVFDNIKNRFVDQDISNGRVEILKEYNKLMFDRLPYVIKGVGLYQYNIKLGALSSAHNSIQEIYVAWGMLGGFIFSLFFSLLLKRITLCSKRKPTFLLYIPLLVFLITTLSGQFISSSKYWFILPLFMCVYFKKSVRPEEE